MTANSAPRLPIWVITRIAVQRAYVGSGQLRTWRWKYLPPVCATSGLTQRSRGSGYNPSLYHLVGTSEQCRRNIDAQRLRCLQVDDELEFSRHLHGHLRWFLAFEDPADIDAGLAKLVRKVRAITHQSARFGKF